MLMGFHSDVIVSDDPARICNQEPPMLADPYRSERTSVDIRQMHSSKLIQSRHGTIDPEKRIIAG